MVSIKTYRSLKARRHGMRGKRYYSTDLGNTVPGEVAINHSNNTFTFIYFRPSLYRDLTPS